MKNKCIRLRRCNREKEFKVQNNLFNSEEKVSKKHLKDFESELFNNGFKKLFDTTKKDSSEYVLHAKETVARLFL